MATRPFVVNLTAPVNAGISDDQGTGTILDNEPRISINNLSCQRDLMSKDKSPLQSPEPDSSRRWSQRNAGRNLADRHHAPECDQQLPRERHNHWLA